MRNWTPKSGRYKWTDLLTYLLNSSKMLSNLTDETQMNILNISNKSARFLLSLSDHRPVCPVDPHNSMHSIRISFVEACLFHNMATKPECNIPNVAWLKIFKMDNRTALLLKLITRLVISRTVCLAFLACMHCVATLRSSVKRTPKSLCLCAF